MLFKFKKNRKNINEKSSFERNHSIQLLQKQLNNKFKTIYKQDRLDVLSPTESIG